jgi:TRAP transporter TAXI family solute receptor
MQVVTIEGTGINSMADLKGKRVSTGSPGSGVEVMAVRVLEAMGLDPKKDIKQERLGAAESVNAIKDRKIDAFFWVGGVPTAALTDLAATPGIKMKLIDHAQYVDAMNKKYGPLYVKATIAPNSYSGQDKPDANIDVWNVLVVSDKMSDKMAYDIVKTLFEHKADLVAVHKEAENIDMKNQSITTPVPFHPGAKRYFEEHGIKIQ